ncbi:MAG TPA: hypothetical protein VHH90_07970 [Polyangia bacterium]|nr:hypothetical protein [Polyangia bacterium]
MTDGVGDPTGRRAWIALIATALIIEATYVFVVSAGHLTHWSYYIAYLNDQAEGFRQGHLHLATEPSPALVASPNPFAGENAGLWYWDVSLHGGHYYLYWGPVPAMLLAAAKALFRIDTSVGDPVMVFALTSVQLAGAAWVIGRAARTVFGNPPVWLQVLSLVVVGFANPMPYNLARGAVYEAAIVGAHAFMIVGIACALEAHARPVTHRRWLALAGAAWALALACRISVAPAIALLVLLAAAPWVGRSGEGRSRLRRRAAPLLAAGLPVAVGFGALLLYNRLRFDEWLDFGRRFQLTWISAPSAPRFILPNVYSYLLRAPSVSCRFPYVFAPANLGARAFPAGYTFPDGYFVYEQVAGTLQTFPWTWAAPVGWVAAWRVWWRSRQLTGRAWAVAAATIAGFVPLIPALTLASSTNRYLGDVAGGLGLAGTFGVWTAYDLLRGDLAWRRAALAAAGTLGVLSVVAGLALGFYGQYAHFPANNPPLADQLVRRLSVCGSAVPPPPN